jgi:MFS transporter, DHA1 family, tetracycline resistance protein
MNTDIKGPYETLTAVQKKRAMLVAFFTLFLDLLGFGVFLPVSPFYAESFGATPAVVTLVGAAYSLMQFVFSPIWGRMSDRSGRRVVVLTSICFACAGWLVLGFASSLAMIVVARLIAGFGNANLGTAQAIIADVTDEKDRAKGMGMVGAAFGMGFLFGPIIGGVLMTNFGPHVPAFVSAGLAVLNLVLAFFFLPETNTRRGQSTGKHSLSPIVALQEAMRLPRAGTLLWVMLVYSIGFSLMESGIQLFIEREYVPANMLGTPEGHQLASKQSTQVLVLVGVVAVIVQGFFIRKLRARFNEKQLIVGGTAIVAASLAYYGLLPFVALPLTAMFVGTITLAFGSGITSPSVSALLSRSADDANQGSVLGAGQAMGSLGRIIGPAVCGMLLTWFRGTPFLVGAVLMAFACIAVWLKVQQPQGTATTAPTGLHR